MVQERVNLGGVAEAASMAFRYSPCSGHGSLNSILVSAVSLDFAVLTCCSSTSQRI